MKRIKYSNEKTNVILNKEKSQFIRELKIIHQFGDKLLQEWIDTRKIGPGLCGYLACAVTHYISLNETIFFQNTFNLNKRNNIIEQLLIDTNSSINNNNNNNNNTFGSLIDNSIKFIESERKKYILTNNQLSNDDKKSNEYLIDEVANYEISDYINKYILKSNNIIFLRRNQYLSGDIENAKYIEKELILKQEKKFSPNYLYLIEMFNPNILFGLNCNQLINQCNKRNIKDITDLLFIFDLDGHFNTGFIDKNTKDFIILDTTNGNYTQNKTITQWIQLIQQMNNQMSKNDSNK